MWLLLVRLAIYELLWRFPALDSYCAASVFCHDVSDRRVNSKCLIYLAVLFDAAWQILVRAAGSLLCRHDYTSVCAAVFPHVVQDMVEQANSFSGSADVSEAYSRGEVWWHEIA